MTSNFDHPVAKPLSRQSLSPKMEDKVPPTTLPQRRQAPKVRLSCDNCSLAKVRCDQERPACQRCVSGRVQCVYSVSRRMGKPPKDRRINNGDDSSSQSKGTASSDNTKRPQLRNPTAGAQASDLSEVPPPAATFTDNNVDSVLVSQLTADSAIDGLYTDFGIPEVRATHSSAFLSDRMLSSSSEVSLDDQNLFGTVAWPGNDGSQHIPQTQVFSTTMPAIDVAEVWDAATANESFPLDPGHTDAGVSSAGASIDHPFHLLLGSAGMQKPIFTSTQTSSSSMCGHLVSSMVYSLSLAVGACTTFSNPMQSRTVDKVLGAGKQALAAVQVLLQCPCSQQSSSAVAIALLILKILDAYCVVTQSLPSVSPAHNVPPTSFGEVPGHSIPASSSSPSTQSLNPRPTQNMVLETPITFGTYKIDAGDEQRFILQLLWMELRKVGRLVDAFAAKYAGSNMGARNRNGEGMAHRSRDNEYSRDTWSSADESIFIALEQFIQIKIQSVRREVNLALAKSDDTAMEFTI